MNITTDNTFAEIETALRELPYPSRPQKPSIATLGRDKTPADFRAHADALEAHERDMVAYADAERIYRHQRTVLEGIWKEKLRGEHSHLNDDTFNACYSKAYDDGHSAGYGEVRNAMWEVVEFAEKIIEANK